MKVLTPVTWYWARAAANHGPLDHKVHLPSVAENLLQSRNLKGCRRLNQACGDLLLGVKCFLRRCRGLLRRRGFLGRYCRLQAHAKQAGNKDG